MARILLGVTGGIAAYKAVELARLAIRAGHAVRVIQTEGSQRFVGALTFASITGVPVLSSEWERDPARGAFPDQRPPDHDPLSHLELVANADAFLIAPASANTLAKLAHGLADNLLTSAALAARTPPLLAPAMNDAMWAHPATRANLALLRGRGVEVLEPGTGPLGSPGEWGVGRLPEPPELLAAVERRLRRPRPGDDLAGLRVLVTAGGTREPLDAVRYLGNRSSGRMGLALAAAAAARGARVEVVAANVTGLPREPGVEYADVRTAAELGAECAERFAEADVLLMAAAVADFRPAEPYAGKLKKDAVGERLELALERTPDVLAGLAAARRPEQTLVGFAAEHGDDAVAHARAKLEGKGLDLVVLNDVAQPGIAFDATENEVTLVGHGGDAPVPRASKAQVASAILDAVLSLRSSTAGRVAAQ